MMYSVGGGVLECLGDIMRATRCKKATAKIDLSKRFGLGHGKKEISNQGLQRFF